MPVWRVSGAVYAAFCIGVCPLHSADFRPLARKNRRFRGNDKRFGYRFSLISMLKQRNEGDGNYKAADKRNNCAERNEKFFIPFDRVAAMRAFVSLFAYFLLTFRTVYHGHHAFGAAFYAVKLPIFSCFWRTYRENQEEDYEQSDCCRRNGTRHAGRQRLRRKYRQGGRTR